MYIQKGLTKLVKPLLSILFSHPLVYFCLEDQLFYLPRQLLAFYCRGELFFSLPRQLLAISCR